MTDDHRSSDPAASRDPVPIGAVLHGVPGGTAEEVLGAIARHLVGKGLVEESFPQALWDRERRYPTGLPTRIPTAIPHADTEHVRTRCLAVATLIQPVKFGEMGGAEGDTVATQLLVLPLVTDPDAMVPALQRMIGALTDEQVVTELLGAADEAELMRLAQLHLSGTPVAGRSEAGPSGLATSYVDGLGASHATGTTPASTVAPAPAPAPAPGAAPTPAPAPTAAPAAAARCGPRVAVKALIVRDGHVLMNRVVTSDGEVLYGPPGGGQDHGEDQVAALIRECREEIGAEVEVHQVACVYEVISDLRLLDSSRIDLFHQVNVAYWCGLAEGHEPGVGSAPDPGQEGTDWLPIGRLDQFEIHPPGLAQWLDSDPSSRPVGLGPLPL